MYPYLLVVSWNFVPANERIERDRIEGANRQRNSECSQRINQWHFHFIITFDFDIKLCILHAFPLT